MTSPFRAIPIAALVLGFASTPRTASAGIHLGDPIASVIAGNNPSVGITSWALPVYRLRLTRCSDGGTVYHNVNATITSSNHIYPPGGCWRTVVIEASGDFTLSGTTPTNYALSMTLEVDEIALDLEHDLDVVTSTPTESAYIEVFDPHWYTNEIAPYVSSSAAVTINPNHAQHAAMVDSLENGSALQFDPL